MPKLNFKKLGLFFIPLIVISIFGLTFYFVKKNQIRFELNQNDSIVNEDDIYDEIDMFPELSINDFYEYLVIEGSRPKIDDNFIAIVIKKVIENIKIINSTLSYEIKDRTPFSFTITFLLSTNGHHYWKTYFFETYLVNN